MVLSGFLKRRLSITTTARSVSHRACMGTLPVRLLPGSEIL